MTWQDLTRSTLAITGVKPRAKKISYRNWLVESQLRPNYARNRSLAQQRQQAFIMSEEKLARLFPPLPSPLLRTLPKVSPRNEKQGWTTNRSARSWKPPRLSNTSTLCFSVIKTSQRRRKKQHNSRSKSSRPQNWRESASRFGKRGGTRQSQNLSSTTLTATSGPSTTLMCRT